MVTLHFDLTRSYCFCFCWGEECACEMTGPLGCIYSFDLGHHPGWGGLPLPPKAKVLAQALEPELGQTAPSGEGEGMGVRLARGLSSFAGDVCSFSMCILEAESCLFL